MKYSIKQIIRKIFNTHDCEFELKPDVTELMEGGIILSRYSCINHRCKKTRLKIHANGGRLTFDSKVPYKDRKDDMGRDPNYDCVFEMVYEKIKKEIEK